MHCISYQIWFYHNLKVDCTTLQQLVPVVINITNYKNCNLFALRILFHWDMNVYFYFWCIILVPLFVVYFNTTLIVIDFGYCSDLQVWWNLCYKEITLFPNSHCKKSLVISVSRKIKEIKPFPNPQCKNCWLFLYPGLPCIKDIQRQMKVLNWLYPCFKSNSEA